MAIVARAAARGCFGANEIVSPRRGGIERGAPLASRFGARRAARCYEGGDEKKMSDLTKDILTSGKAFVEHWGWTQGRLAMNEDGREVEEYDDGAVCFCAEGAIRRAGYEMWKVNAGEPREIAGAVDAALEAIGDLAGDFVHDWNDHPDRTRDEVVAIFDRAIAKAGAAS